MDSPAAPIPSIPLQPAVSSPVEPQNRHWFVGALALAVIFIISAASYIVYQIIPSTRINKAVQDCLSRGGSPTGESFPPSCVFPSPSPTLDPTANWKTYANPRYNFSFKYPSDYQMEESPGYVSILSPLLPTTGKGYELKDGEVKVEIYILPSPANDSLEAYVEEKRVQTKENMPESKIFEETEIRIDEERAILLKWEAFGTGETIFLIKGGHRIEIAKYPLETFRQTEFDQILSTLKFTDTENVKSSVKNVVYKKTSGWTGYKSNTGYSLQIPPTFSDADGSGEESRDNGCYMFFGNNAGGIISVKVVPYSGGSRRELYGIQPGYDYSFEEALVQGKKSLIIEAGPIGDSGSGSGIVIPVGNHALIISWANRAKNSVEFNSLLQSIALQSSLDLNQCGK